MSVHLSMKFSDKVYTSMYWVHACIYFHSWFFVLIERAHTCTYSLRLSTYDVQLLCSCLRPAGPPAPCWPAWICKQSICCRIKTNFVKHKSLHSYHCPPPPFVLGADAFLAEAAAPESPARPAQPRRQLARLARQRRQLARQRWPPLISDAASVILPTWHKRVHTCLKHV